jgi:hypothetical protein
MYEGSKTLSTGGIGTAEPDADDCASSDCTPMPAAATVSASIAATREPAMRVAAAEMRLYEITGFAG